MPGALRRAPLCTSSITRAAPASSKMAAHSWSDRSCSVSFFWRSASLPVKNSTNDVQKERFAGAEAVEEEECRCPLTILTQRCWSETHERER